jgi:hypothetical protein
MMLPQSPRNPRRSSAATVLLTLVGGALALPGPALGAPEYATPDPGSPAGTEYGLPLQQGRDAGGGGSDGFGGAGGTGSHGGSGGAGGGGGAGRSAATVTSGRNGSAQLFGAGIAPRAGSAASDSSGKSSSPPSSRRHGDDAPNVGLTARAVADVARTKTADGEVAVIVAVLLAGATALAVALRLATRRSPPTHPA